MSLSREADIETRRQRLTRCTYKPRKAQYCWQPPKARERQGRTLPRTSEGTCPCWHLDFRRLAPQTVREYTFVVLGLSAMVRCTVTLGNECKPLSWPTRPSRVCSHLLPPSLHPSNIGLGQASSLQATYDSAPGPLYLKFPGISMETSSRSWMGSHPTQRPSLTAYVTSKAPLVLLTAFTASWCLVPCLVFVSSLHHVRLMRARTCLLYSWLSLVPRVVQGMCPACSQRMSKKNIHSQLSIGADSKQAIQGKKCLFFPSTSVLLIIKEIQIKSAMRSLSLYCECEGNWGAGLGM